MNTSHPTMDMSQYGKDMTSYTYIQNVIGSIRLQAVGQGSNGHGDKMLTALSNMVQTYKPVKPSA